MTILEELIETGLKVCENSRSAGQKSNSRAAVLLTKAGRTYSGCDVRLPNNEAHGVTAERAAFLAAVADGATEFEVSIICSVLLLLLTLKT